MYPDWLYQNAWDPGIPHGARSCVVIHGPSDETHVAALARAGASETTRATSSRTRITFRQLCAVRDVMRCPCAEQGRAATRAPRPQYALAELRLDRSRELWRRL